MLLSSWEKGTMSYNKTFWKKKKKKKEEEKERKKGRRGHDVLE